MDELLIHVLLIARTEPIWPLWLNTASKILQRSLTIGLDRRSAPPVGIASFLATLAEFHSANTDPGKVWQRPGAYLRHAYASLLCIAPPEMPCALCQVCSLKIVLGSDDVFIASGTLEDWRTAAINGTASDDLGVRTFFNKIINHFDAQGLGFVFSELVRRDRLDGTFTLTKV